MTNKQKFFLLLAWMVLAVSLVGIMAAMKLAQDTGSRIVINATFIVMFLIGSTGLLVSAIVGIRAFRNRPLFEESPLWVKLCDYYAGFMVVWGMLVMLFSGNTAEERVDRWQLEQISDLTPIHVGMIIIGLTYFAIMWLVWGRNPEQDRG